MRRRPQSCRATVFVQFVPIVRAVDSSKSNGDDGDDKQLFYYVIKVFQKKKKNYDLYNEIERKRPLRISRSVRSCEIRCEKKNTLSSFTMAVIKGICSRIKKKINK